ncbi:MAG: arylamine N-acetyltransferase [Chloroflexia bacterium]|nr:arylamine N-acetyltransferase [Chloroflexia bacterium]MDQ3514690.1 arylamine N-acetyltransferase [Chloroflexota bacterium]
MTGDERRDLPGPGRPSGIGATLTGQQREAYLDRIGYRCPAAPDGETLAALSLAHLRTVPFENLDVFHRVPIRLDLDSVYHKVVERRRGGFCYELNALFAALLGSVGYGVSLLAMRFATEDGYGPEHDHLSLAVWPGTPDGLARPAGQGDGSDAAGSSLAGTDRSSGAASGMGTGPWLADVGAGRHSLSRPVRLDDPAEQPHPADGATHRVVRGVGPHWHLWRRDPGEDWRELYRFTRHPHPWQAFASRCAWYQDEPASVFRQTAWCTRLTGDGRITLRDGLLSVTDPATGERDERAIPPDDVAATLSDQFGITLDRSVLPPLTAGHDRANILARDASGDGDDSRDTGPKTSTEER